MRAVTPVLPSYNVARHEIHIAKDQPEYNLLPAIVGTGGDVLMTTHWELTWRERIQILFGGSLWVQIMTFGYPVQPIKISVKEPPMSECL
jgi:hypothetical protein